MRTRREKGISQSLEHHLILIQHFELIDLIELRLIYFSNKVKFIQSLATELFKKVRIFFTVSHTVLKCSVVIFPMITPYNSHMMKMVVIKCFPNFLSP